MARGRTNVTSLNRWRYCVAPLLLVVALLGHDVLMADHARAVEPTTPHRAGTHRPHAFGSIPALVAIPQETPAPDHRADCGVARPAVLPAGDDTDPTGREARPTVVAVPLFTGRSRPDAVVWPEPTWPPGVRRALLQVFRI